jgi:glycosyltransferase involved in cell wall biosynthesis
VRDLWPESLLASGIGRDGSLFIQTLSAISDFLYRHSEKVVVVTEAFKKDLVCRRGVAVQNIEVVTNGVEPDFFVPGINREATRESLGITNKFVVSYIGTIGAAHGLTTVLKAAQQLHIALEEIVFLLVGEGADRTRLQEMCSEMRLSNVRFVGQQPRQMIPAVIAASDVCLVLLRNSELFKTVLPSKMFEFFSAARPIILGVDGEARQVLEMARAGIYVQPEDVQGLVDAIIRLHSRPDLRVQYGQNGRHFVLDHFSRERKAAEYISILKALREHSPSRTIK